MHWNASPEVIHIGFVSIRWYGLFFALSFIYGLRFTRKIFIREKVPLILADKLLSYMMVGTLVGARLGHTLFYEPQIYLADPLRILKIWEGGLASHGAVIGILSVLIFFSHKYLQKSPLWILDRLSIPVAFGGALIRMGNLFNSEIIGRPSNLPWAIILDRVDQIPRHPTQIYESFAYFLTFFLLKAGAEKKGLLRFPGVLFGFFLVAIFGFRIFVEFFKENQVAAESGFILNFGQWFSIPLVILGLFLIIRMFYRVSRV